MSAQLIQTPPTVAFQRNAMPVVLQTDNINTDRAYIELTMTDHDGPAPGESFSFIFNGITRTFTFSATPDNTGWQLPTKPSPQTAEEYIGALAERMRINTIITADFDITEDTALFRIRLTWRNVEPLSITQTNNLSQIFVFAHSVIIISNVTNLGAYITVHNATTHDQLIALAGSYDYTTRQCTFDIRAAFEMSPHLPDNFYGAATSAFMRYYVRYADRYGSPAKPEIMHKSATLTTIHGGTSSRSNALLTNAPIIPLHNWATRTGDVFVKEVTKEQPDWLYFVSATNWTGLIQDIVLKHSDGTEEVLDSGNLFDLVAGEVRYTQTGFRQLGLHFYIPSRTAPKNRFIVGYNVRIKRQNTGEVLLTARYDLELYHQFNALFLLFDTGLGGMESVRLKGKRQLKYEVNRTIIENSDGELSTIFPDGSELVNVSTGWYDLYYLEQLRQLLLGDIYLIQRTSPLTQTGGEEFAFKKCITDSKSFEFVPDDNELHALEFTFKLAKPDSQINNY